MGLTRPGSQESFRSGGNRQKRSDVKTILLGAGQLALAFLRYSIAAEIAGAWAKFGGLGAPLTNLATTFELSAIHNAGAASRFERAQGAAWSHLVRERESIQTIEEELVEINGGRLRRCVNDQISEFSGRYMA